MSKVRCDFCGETKHCEGTATVGRYCIECHEIVIEQSEEAIRIIKSREEALIENLVGKGKP